VPRIVALFIIIALPFLKCKNKGVLVIQRKRTFFFILMLLVFFLSSWVNKEAFETFISRMLTLVSAFVITCCYSDDEYFDALDSFLYAVSIVAIITEVITYLMPSLILAFPKVTNTVRVPFAHFFFGSMELTNIGRITVRANGIFWEPGAYAIYLIIGILYQLYGHSVPNAKHLLVYVIALLLTFSTTGYVTFAFIIAAYTFSRRSNRFSVRIKALLILGSITVVLAAIFTDSNLIQDMVFGKIFSGTSSATTRYSSIFNGMKVALAHPVYGVGNTYRGYMDDYVQQSIFNNGGTTVTNTIVAQFVCYGVVFGLIFLVGTLNFFKKWALNKYDLITICISILLAYTGERFFSFFPFVIVIYGLCQKGTITTEEIST
jgi:hypothetical protein